MDRALFEGPVIPRASTITLGLDVCVFCSRKGLPYLGCRFAPLLRTHPYPYLDLAVELFQCSQMFGKIAVRVRNFRIMEID